MDRYDKEPQHETFEILSQNLFSILASKNKEIYTEALFVLRKAFKQEMTIRRNDLAAMLIASLDEKMYEMDLAAEETDNDNSGAIKCLTRYPAGPS